MRQQKKNGLKYYQFESMVLPGLTQAIFSRQGGLSKPPWSSLNLGGTVGDDPENVKGNLDLLLGSLEYKFEKLVQVRQIHSAAVIVAQSPMDGQLQGDAVITNQPELLMLMRFADCVPILFYDPVKQAAGIAHAGWQGTVKEVSFHAARAMEREFGSKPSDILAGIGPSIGPDHYYIQNDVIKQVETVFPEHLDELLMTDSDGVKLDLWKANKISLQRAGVENIEISGICTGCNTKDWFSHRAERGITGRFGAVIGLR